MPDISRTVVGMASNFCVKLWLGISNNFAMSDVWTTNGVEMLKVRNKVKFDLNLWAYISRTKIAMVSKLYVVLWIKLANIC